MMPAFVWTKMGLGSGEGLADIVRRKEAERAAGQGIFWWGVGSSLGDKVCQYAKQEGGTLPVLFSMALALAKATDTSPAAVWRWTAWEDRSGRVHQIPPHVKVISRGANDKARHYALACQSHAPIFLDTKGRRFDPRQCLTPSGKIPGPSMVTALLLGDPAGHQQGAYHIAFRATLIEPWCVKLVNPIPS
jgi:hypothetical protein